MWVLGQIEVARLFLWTNIYPRRLYFHHQIWAQSQQNTHPTSTPKTQTQMSWFRLCLDIHWITHYTQAHTGWSLFKSYYSSKNKTKEKIEKKHTKKIKKKERTKKINLIKVHFNVNLAITKGCPKAMTLLPWCNSSPFGKVNRKKQDPHFSCLLTLQHVVTK